MRIGYIYPFKAYPPRGGNQLHAYQIARHFLMLGHQVATFGDETVAGVQAFPRSVEGFVELEKLVDVLYVRVDGSKLVENPILKQVLPAARKPTVWEINAPANENLAFSWLGGDRQVDGGFARWLDIQRRRMHAWSQLPGIWREEVFRRSLAERVGAAICVSGAMGDYAADGLGIQRIEVIPNAADPDTHFPGGKKAQLPGSFDGALTVLYAGSPIYPWQGLGLLRETIRQCFDAGDPIRFVLLLNQQPSFEVEPDMALTVVGLPHGQVAEYLRAVDAAVVIHPEFFWSKWGAHGSPMKLFDYLACGTPVVASNIGQLAEIVEPGRNGALFDNTPEGLRSCLLDLVRRRSQLPAWGRHARADVIKKYNWQNVAQRTLEVLRDVGQ